MFNTLKLLCVMQLLLRCVSCNYYYAGFVSNIINITKVNNYQTGELLIAFFETKSLIPAPIQFLSPYFYVNNAIFPNDLNSCKYIKMTDCPQVYTGQFNGADGQYFYCRFTTVIPVPQILNVWYGGYGITCNSVDAYLKIPFNYNAGSCYTETIISNVLTTVKMDDRVCIIPPTTAPPTTAPPTTTPSVLATVDNSYPFVNQGVCSPYNAQYIITSQTPYLTSYVSNKKCFSNAMGTTLLSYNINAVFWLQNFVGGTGRKVWTSSFLPTVAHVNIYRTALVQQPNGVLSFIDMSTSIVYWNSFDPSFKSDTSSSYSTSIDDDGLGMSTMDMNSNLIIWSSRSGLNASNTVANVTALNRCSLNMLWDANIALNFTDYCGFASGQIYNYVAPKEETSLAAYTPNYGIQFKFTKPLKGNETTLLSGVLFCPAITNDVYNNFNPIPGTYVTVLCDVLKYYNPDGSFNSVVWPCGTNFANGGLQASFWVQLFVYLPKGTVTSYYQRQILGSTDKVFTSSFPIFANKDCECKKGIIGQLYTFYHGPSCSLPCQYSGSIDYQTVQQHAWCDFNGIPRSSLLGYQIQGQVITGLTTSTITLPIVLTKDWCNENKPTDEMESFYYLDVTSGKCEFKNVYDKVIFTDYNDRYISGANSHIIVELAKSQLLNIQSQLPKNMLLNFKYITTSTLNPILMFTVFRVISIDISTSSITLYSTDGNPSQFTSPHPAASFLSYDSVYIYGQPQCINNRYSGTVLDVRLDNYCRLSIPPISEVSMPTVAINQLQSSDLCVCTGKSCVTIYYDQYLATYNCMKGYVPGPPYLLPLAGLVMICIQPQCSPGFFGLYCGGVCPACEFMFPRSICDQGKTGLGVCVCQSGLVWDSDHKACVDPYSRCATTLSNNFGPSPFTQACVFAPGITYLERININIASSLDTWPLFSETLLCSTPWPFADVTATRTILCSGYTLGSTTETTLFNFRRLGTTQYNSQPYLFCNGRGLARIQVKYLAYPDIISYFKSSSYLIADSELGKTSASGYAGNVFFLPVTSDVISLKGVLSVITYASVYEYARTHGGNSFYIAGQQAYVFLSLELKAYSKLDQSSYPCADNQHQCGCENCPNMYYTGIIYAFYKFIPLSQIDSYQLGGFLGYAYDESVIVNCVDNQNKFLYAPRDFPAMTYEAVKSFAVNNNFKYFALAGPEKDGYAHVFNSYTASYVTKAITTSLICATGIYQCGQNNPKKIWAMYEVYETLLYQPVFKSQNVLNNATKSMNYYMNGYTDYLTQSQCECSSGSYYGLQCEFTCQHYVPGLSFCDRITGVLTCAVGAVFDTVSQTCHQSVCQPGFGGPMCLIQCPICQTNQICEEGVYGTGQCMCKDTTTRVDTVTKLCTSTYCGVNNACSMRGTCLDDGIATASCVCEYPWVGEYCQFSKLLPLGSEIVDCGTVWYDPIVGATSLSTAYTLYYNLYPFLISDRAWPSNVIQNSVDANYAIDTFGDAVKFTPGNSLLLNMPPSVDQVKYLCASSLLCIGYAQLVDEQMYVYLTDVPPTFSALTPTVTFDSLGVNLTHTTINLLTRTQGYNCTISLTSVKFDYNSCVYYKKQSPEVEFQIQTIIANAASAGNPILQPSDACLIHWQTVGFLLRLSPFPSCTLSPTFMTPESGCKVQAGQCYESCGNSGFKQPRLSTAKGFCSLNSANVPVCDCLYYNTLNGLYRPGAERQYIGYTCSIDALGTCTAAVVNQTYSKTPICSGHGSCVSVSSSSSIATDIVTESAACACRIPYTGTFCERQLAGCGPLTADGSACSGSQYGTCAAIPGSSSVVCNCIPTRGGPLHFCENDYTPCVSANTLQVCSNQGSCLGNSTAGFACSCTQSPGIDQYNFGTHCEIKGCDAPRSNGYCVPTSAYNSQSVCYPAYFGSACALSRCPNTLGSNGTYCACSSLLTPSYTVSYPILDTLGVNTVKLNVCYQDCPYAVVQGVSYRCGINTTILTTTGAPLRDAALGTVVSHTCMMDTSLGSGYSQTSSCVCGTGYILSESKLCVPYCTGSSKPNQGAVWPASHTVFCVFPPITTTPTTITPTIRTVLPSTVAPPQTTLTPTSTPSQTPSAIPSTPVVFTTPMPTIYPSSVKSNETLKPTIAATTPTVSSSTNLQSIAVIASCAFVAIVVLVLTYYYITTRKEYLARYPNIALLTDHKSAL